MDYLQSQPIEPQLDLQQDFFPQPQDLGAVPEDKEQKSFLLKADSISSEIGSLGLRNVGSCDRTIGQGPDASFDERLVEAQKESMAEVNSDKVSGLSFTRIGNSILSQLTSNVMSTPFRFPIDPYEDGVVDYYDIVKSPMDLQTIRLRLQRGKYTTKDEFYHDLELIVSNSRLYNKNNPDFLTITKRFENLCVKVRRNIDPKRKKPAKQVSYGQISQAKKQKSSRKVKAQIANSSQSYDDSRYSERY